MPVLEVGPTRPEAGRFGSGFKPRPKSDAGIRQVPLVPLVVEAIRRQLPPGTDPDDLVFTGPGGGRPACRGAPGRCCHATTSAGHALAKLADPAVPLRPTARRVLLLLRDGGPQRVDHDQDELTARWAALLVAGDPLLDAVDLHDAHDLGHTYATWLEDAGIPARVIDELMGHQASSRGGHLRGSAIGANYRHTTPEMADRVVDAIQQRLTVVLGVAELALERRPNPSTLRVF
jgi:integrase